MGLGDVFGEGSTAEQFLIWGVLQQLLGPLLSPVIVELGKLVNSAVPLVPISPQDAAAAVQRGILAHGDGEDAANDSGIAGNDFATLVKMAGNAPALSAVLELLRRGLINPGSNDGEQVSARGALTDQGIRNDWHDLILELAVSIPDQAQVLNAWLEGQIEEPEARDRLIKAGMDPHWIQTAYNANGQAPTPTQALELLNRGIIPADGTGPDSVSYHQAFLEGPWRNKWRVPFQALAEYLPPPRTVTAMYHGGQIDHAQAAELLTKQGLAPELVTAYLSPSTTSHTAADKHLSKTDLVTAYEDGLLTRGQAQAALVALTYSAHDAATILDLADVRVTTQQVTAGITRVRTLFQGGKLTVQEARATLHKLGVDAQQARDLVDTWGVTQAHATKVLSASQIESAWYYRLIGSADAIALLMGLGYDAFDAWISLSVRGHGPVQDVPRPHSPYPAPPPPPKVVT